MVVSRYLRREHGITKCTKKTPEEIEAIRQRVREGATRPEIMQEFGLSDFGTAGYFQIEEAATEMELELNRYAQRMSWPARGSRLRKPCSKDRCPGPPTSWM